MVIGALRVPFTKASAFGLCVVRLPGNNSGSKPLVTQTIFCANWGYACCIPSHPNGVLAMMQSACSKTLFSQKRPHRDHGVRAIPRLSLVNQGSRKQANHGKS